MTEFGWCVIAAHDPTGTQEAPSNWEKDNENIDEFLEDNSSVAQGQLARQGTEQAQEGVLTWELS